MDALFFRRLNLWTKFFFGHEKTLGTILNASGARPDAGSRPNGAAAVADEWPCSGDRPGWADGLAGVLEKRVLGLESRVLALEAATTGASDAAKELKDLAGAVADAHSKFQGDLVSLIDDHIEILKLVQVMARPYDSGTSKVVRAYIHGAEARLEQFQKRFAELEAAGERLKKGTRDQGTTVSNLTPEMPAWANVAVSSRGPADQPLPVNPLRA